jgi:transcription elongation factor GreA
MELVTAAEKAALEARLAYLINNRSAVSLKIAEAKALGDLKENGDYHAAREQQGMEEAEIKRLTDKVHGLVVIDENRKSTGIVFLGATAKIVEVSADDPSKHLDDPEMVRMVGEISGTISMDYMEVTPQSPMGEALMKARVGDVVGVRTPRGTKKFKILEVS